MFIKTVGEPTKIKKIIYLIASTFLGLLLSLIIHAVIEIIYLNWAQGQNRIVPFYRSCSLHPLIQITLLVAGIVGGFNLGRFWWRKVYVERVWAKK